MTTLREAAQQALKSMDKATRFMSDSDYKKLNQAIEDLKAALEEPQSTHSADCYQWHHKCAIAEVERLRAALVEPVQEPVAWMYVNSDGECEQIEHETPPDDPSVTPLYTAPPASVSEAPQRKPLPASEIVTMYDESPRGDSDMITFARAIERAHGIGEAK